MAVSKEYNLALRINERINRLADEIAAKRGISRADTLRLALDVGLPLLNGGVNPDIKRLVFLLENVNLGLTLLLDKEHPDDVPKIIELAVANVETHHG